MKTRNLGIGTWICLALTSLTWGQLPTSIYDPSTGIMYINSGDIDLVAVFIEGPDVTGSCNLCDGMNLPGEDALAGASTWTLGFINGSSQWIRTNPLQGRGFLGSMSNYYIDGAGMEQPWPQDVPPFLDFPNIGEGIATYDTGYTPSNNPFGTVTYASDDGSTYTGNAIIGSPAVFAEDDEYVSTLGMTLEVPAPGVLLNDYEPFGDGLTASLATDPVFGDVTVNLDGSFTYIAPPVGSVSPGTIDTFTYTASGNYDADNATVSIILVPEPSIARFLGIASLALLGLRRRKRGLGDDT